MRTNMAYIGLPPTHDALGDSGRRQTMCRESTEGDETPKGLVPGWIRRGELRAINAATAGSVPSKSPASCRRLNGSRYLETYPVTRDHFVPLLAGLAGRKGT